MHEALGNLDANEGSVIRGVPIMCLDPDSADPLKRKSGAQVGDIAFVLGVLTTNHVRDNANLEVQKSTSPHLFFLPRLWGLVRILVQTQKRDNINVFSNTPHHHHTLAFRDDVHVFSNTTKCQGVVV